MSELPPGTPPSRWTFPNRNRLLAALGDAVLVIEGSLTSGAMQTADQAAHLGRPVFAVPGSIYAEGHRGCNLLMRDGAVPALDPEATVEEFLLQTRIERGERRPPEPKAGPGASRQDPFRDLAAAGREAILEAMDERPCSIDALVLRTGMAARRLTAALAELELAGLVTQGRTGTVHPGALDRGAGGRRMEHEQATVSWDDESRRRSKRPSPRSCAVSSPPTTACAPSRRRPSTSSSSPCSWPERGVERPSAITRTDVSDFAAALAEAGRRRRGRIAAGGRSDGQPGRGPQKPYARSTIARKLSVIRSFLGFCQDNGLIETSPGAGVGSPKVPRRLPQVLTPVQAADLLEPSGSRQAAGSAG